MKQIVNAKQMKEIDDATIRVMGVPSMVLMERAALAAVEELKKNFCLTRTLVVCGSGNNGGDGMAVARILHNEGYDAAIFLAGKEASFTENTKTQWNIVNNYKVPVVKNFAADEYTTIVDAVFGVGLSREVSGSYRELLRKINASRVPVLAVDIPSGIDADDGSVRGEAVKARQTVTFSYGKCGLYLYPGADYAGKVTVKDVGIYGTCQDTVMLVDEEVKNWLPARPADGNKGTFGKVLICAGSENMCGAAYFAAKAALLSGAGMVRIFTEECNRVILQQLFPEAMLTTWEKGEADFTEKLKNAQQWADVVLLGPGIGTGSDAARMTEYLWKEETEKPLVADADALNLLSRNPRWLQEGCRPRIVTPHMGEMARLLQISVSDLKKEARTCIRDFRELTKATVVLKDACTWIETDVRTYLHAGGNSGMATAGSGDILAGLIAGLTAQKMLPNHAAVLGVYLHGRAGALAGEQYGERSMRAEDILREINRVLR